MQYGFHIVPSHGTNVSTTPESLDKEHLKVRVFDLSNLADSSSRLGQFPPRLRPHETVA